MMRYRKPNDFFGLVGLALVLLALLLAIVPFVAQDLNPEAFRAQCELKLQEVRAAEQEVIHGGQDPAERLDGAKADYEGFGCTWDMFDEPTATVGAGAQGAMTATPAFDPTATFEAECQQGLQTYLYEQGRVDRGEKQPEDSLDDAINNFLGYGCTWDMFNATPTPAEAVTTPADTSVATAIPVATTDPAVIPTATVDTTFVDVCRSKLELVQHHQAEVNAGNEGPTAHLDDAINNFLGHGCTWDMFE